MCIFTLVDKNHEAYFQGTYGFCHYSEMPLIHAVKLITSTQSLKEHVEALYAKRLKKGSPRN